MLILWAQNCTGDVNWCWFYASVTLTYSDGQFLAKMLQWKKSEIENEIRLIENGKFSQYVYGCITATTLSWNVCIYMFDATKYLGNIV